MDSRVPSGDERGLLCISSGRCWVLNQGLVLHGAAAINPSALIPSLSLLRFQVHVMCYDQNPSSYLYPPPPPPHKCRKIRANLQSARKSEMTSRSPKHMPKRSDFYVFGRGVFVFRIWRSRFLRRFGVVCPLKVLFSAVTCAAVLSLGGCCVCLELGTVCTVMLYVASARCWV